MAENDTQIVGLIMGSESDWETMRHAAEALEGLGVRCAKKVVSAHRTPDDLFRYAEAAENEGLTLILAGAGGAAHLPGMTAAKTIVPVIGVPVVATPLRGLDALLSIMQMPAGVGVATVCIGARGAAHAAHFAASLLALDNEALHARLCARREGALAGPRPRKRAGGKVVVLAEHEAHLEVLRHAAEQLSALGVPHEVRALDGDITADELAHVTLKDEAEGVATYIAGSDQGPGLACKVASVTMLPVLGVPIVSASVDSLDQFLQPFSEMPPGVATFAIGRAGAINAALFAATVLSTPTSAIRAGLKKRREEQVRRAREMNI